MGFPTEVHLIKCTLGEQWHINFPGARAQAMRFKRGEVVEWLVEDNTRLVLNRPEAPPSALKKNGGDAHGVR